LTGDRLNEAWSSWEGRRRAILLGLFLALIVVLVTIGTHEIFDDPWILYRYATNLAGGRGWVFNPGEPSSNAVTSPLSVLVLAGLVSGGLPVETASGAVFAVGMWCASFFTFLTLRVMRLELAGAIAAILVATSPVLIGLRGMESALTLGLLSLALFLAVTRNAVAAGFAFGLVILARPDTAIFVGTLFILAVIRQRRAAFRAALACAAIVGVWLVVAPGLTGGVLPSTLAAKIALAQSGAWQPFFVALLQMASLGSSPLGLALTILLSAAATWRYLRTRNARILVLWLALVAFGLPAIGLTASPVTSPTRLGILMPLAVAGVVCVFVQRRKELMGFSAGVVAFVAVLSISGVAFFPWYTALPVYACLVMVGVGSSVLVSTSVGWRAISTGAVVALSLGLAISVGLSREIARMSPDRMEYADVARWLRSNSAADASVFALEIGRIGFLSDRRIVDALGLLDGQANEHIRNQDWNWWVYAYEPDFLVWHRGMELAQESGVRDEPWFQTTYRLAFETPTMEVFERIAPIPRPSG
jgi:hypothetical protein